ncbi:MAG: hypothetical protein ACTSRX_07055 [Promethearchaeota archaeon]
MDMLQIPSTFTDLVGWFDSLNIEFKVLIAIVAILLSMVLIFIAFKLIEIFFLLLRVILDGFVKIIRKSSKIKKKIKMNNGKSETSEEIDSLKPEKYEEYEIDKIIDSVGEKEEELTISEENASLIKNVGSISRSDHQEFTSDTSTRIIKCPNCGNEFSQNSYSKIGDTVFASCEECGKRYITNEEKITEN